MAGQGAMMWILHFMALDMNNITDKGHQNDKVGIFSVPETVD